MPNHMTEQHVDSHFIISPTKVTNNSTSYVDVFNQDFQLNHKGIYRIFCFFEFSTAAATEFIRIRFFASGDKLSDLKMEVPNVNGLSRPCTLHLLTGDLAAGTHNFTLKFKGETTNAAVSIKNVNCSIERFLRF